MPKTLSQLEREYALYIAKTRVKAAKKRLLTLKKPLPTFVVLTRHVTTTAGGRALWGKFRVWSDYSNNLSNLKAAIRYAIGYLGRSHIGTIVYIGAKGSRQPVPVFEAKWGHDGVPYRAWKNNPAAMMWKRKIGS